MEKYNLNGLSVSDLYKFWHSLTPVQLKELFDILTPQGSEQILDRLPIDKKLDLIRHSNSVVP